MKNVYLNAWESVDLEQGIDPSLSALPLFRRMTPLQKSVLLAVWSLNQRWPGTLERLQEFAAPIYFTSAYGELGAMLRVTQTIHAQQWPVSPKDFQHSVLNAALAYLAMSHQWHQPAFAISGGFTAADSSLFLATQRIAGGTELCNVLVHAGETHRNSVDGAQAEVLICSDQAWSPLSYRLAKQSWTRRDKVGPPLPHTQAARIFREEASDLTVPWLLEDKAPILHRHIETQLGQVLVTEWQKQ